MSLLPTLLLNTVPEAMVFLAMASGSFSCQHRGGLYVIATDVFCRDCETVLGSVWDEVGADSFDGFDKAKEADYNQAPYIESWNEQGENG
jgi:hypothetical protein